MQHLDGLWAKTFPDPQGLVPCVVQDARTRAVLMVAWVSKEALGRALQTGWATYWSRSRKALWVKGENSGHRQRLLQVRLDCDGDTLLYLVDARLPACHEGTDTCFSWRRTPGGWTREPEQLGPPPQAEEPAAPEPEVPEPATDLDALARAPTASPGRLTEPAAALDAALRDGPPELAAARGADLLTHLALALRGRGLSFRDVLAEFDRRLESAKAAPNAEEG